ncbi:MAG: kinase [Desulfuromonadales bacterium]|nr:MAG: kinase [Desulfuromonadales bacterium]
MEQRLLRSLLNASAYPDHTESVELIQTHVSYIFLTDRYVYKVKKPVDFGFLNFSTLDRRRFYCDEEVRLNRRLCPDIYLGVAQVRETLEGASFFGNGRVIDYAVKMKRLPAERMLDRMLRENRVTETHIRAVARAVGLFHQVAERGEEIDAGGSLATIRANWEENFQQARLFRDITISGRDAQLIEAWVERFMSEHADQFHQRVNGGFIRDCDGDIHMENICLRDEENVCIFDCIEFNTRFRHGDTAADIAFLLMDFDYHLRPDFSRIFLDEYIGITGDSEATAVLDFYKVYRAFIRGKVESMRLQDPQIPEEEKVAARERAGRYLRLARGYVLRGALRRSLVITCGPTGSGKSFLARELALELGVAMASSDVVRKELAGLEPTDRRAEAFGEGIYAEEATARTYGALLDRAEAALSAGQSIIIDATFRRRSDRRPFTVLAKSQGVPLVIIHATCPEETVRERLDARMNDSREPSDGRWEIYLRQRDEFEPPGEREGAVITVDTSQLAAEMADTILGAMGILPCG